MVDTRWDKLLKNIRFRGTTSASKSDGRDPFENDYWRLISSAPIRRLQDKTQVFPLEKSDFVRTRLTHSLEVSAIARSLGKSVEKRLLDTNKLSLDYKGFLSSLLATAGLTHDLGNSPFGHFGEVAIQKYFEDYFSKQTVLLNDQEKADFLNFDGNVQTFRILRRLYFQVDQNGYNLTYPTLSVIVKYPSSSLCGNIKKEHLKHIKDKKFGYFCSEQEDFLKISHELGLNNQRHPLTYLLEASDDIAYMAADIEDAAKLRILSYDQIYSAFDQLNEKELGINFEKNYQELRSLDIDKLDISVQRLRVLAQTRMVESVVDEFINNYDAIMDGSFQKELLSLGASGEIKEAFGSLMKIVLKNKKVIDIELAGWNVIKGLLDEYMPACQSHDFRKDSKSREGRLYLTISSSYRHLFENHSSYPNQVYNRIQLITDFISGMTDNYALELYQKLSGIRI